MDWKAVIAELAVLDMSQGQIARALGSAQSTISDLANGKTEEPRHSLGRALLRLLVEKRKAKNRQDAKASADLPEKAGA